MNAFTAVTNHIEAANKSDDDLIFMGLVADELTTKEARITSAAITEILCNRHPELNDKIDAFMDDFENPLTFTQFLAHEIAA